MNYKNLIKFTKFLDGNSIFQNEYPFNEIYLWSEKNLKDECIEYIVSMMMEPFDEIVEPYVYKMSSEEDKFFTIPASRTIQDLRRILEEKYSDILKIDFSKKESNQNFWYISKNKEEPRLADRFHDNGSELE